MKRIIIALCIFVMALAFAEVRPDQNLLLNSDMTEKDLLGNPVNWRIHGQGNTACFRNGAGPQKQTTCLFNGEKMIGGEFSLRQMDIFLIPGETYRLSALVRTKNFKSPHFGVSVATTGWGGEVGITDEIKPTQDWTRVEKVITAPKGVSFAVVFAVNFSGELEVTDFRITAEGESACQKTRLSFHDWIKDKLNLVPMSPLLRQIPRSNPVVTFRFFGKLPAGDVADYELVITASDSKKTVKVPVSRNDITVTLPADFKRGELTAKIIGRSDGKTVFSRGYDYGIVDIPKVPASHKRLNNLVTELLNETVRENGQTFDLAVTRQGWVFIAVQNGDNAGAEVVLDNAQTVIKSDTPRQETFRELPMGMHKLTVRNARKGARIIARSIPVILNYCPGVNSGVWENPPYDWEFQKKYVLPAVTTQNGGRIPDKELPWFREQGYQWLGNLISRDVKDETDLARRLNSDWAMMKSPYHDGVTCDEQAFNQRMLTYYYTMGLHAFRDKRDRLVYTWTGGKPATPSLDHDFISASINVSGGRGLILHEVYFPTMATEAEARKMVYDTMASEYTAYDTFFPIAKRNVGLILGNFNQMPILSLAHYPEADLKYFLDMQLNILANEPAFKDLPCTGYWGSYYTDHEFHRWAFMLFRHYCVEGNTAMLSEKYGLAYNPKTILNGDFKETLKPWTCTGNVSMDSLIGFAFSSEGRYNSTEGDTFAVLSKVGDETSAVSQKVTNLVPGKAYCLQFAAFDRDDAKARRLNPRQYGITATISGNPEIRKDLSWIHVDKRVNGRYDVNNGVARINLQHIVFIAPAREVTVTFDNAKALKGENLGINCVSLLPFILEE